MSAIPCRLGHSRSAAWWSARSANRCFQWQRELFDRFREPFEILRGLDLRTSYGTNSWLNKSQIITSIDWAKRGEVEESLSRASWDLLIVDEAQRMRASDAEHRGSSQWSSVNKQVIDTKLIAFAANELHGIRRPSFTDNAESQCRT
jgi:SNF2 family DNA or RNA helicase